MNESDEYEELHFNGSVRRPDIELCEACGKVPGQVWHTVADSGGFEKFNICKSCKEKENESNK